MSTIRSHILSKVCVVKYLLSMCNLLVDTCTKGSKSQIILSGFIRNRFYSRLLNSKSQRKKKRKKRNQELTSIFLLLTINHSWRQLHLHLPSSDKFNKFFQEFYLSFTVSSRCVMNVLNYWFFLKWREQPFVLTSYAI